jgi:hypothetical protein
LDDSRGCRRRGYEEAIPTGLFEALGEMVGPHANAMHVRVACRRDGEEQKGLARHAAEAERRSSRVVQMMREPLEAQSTLLVQGYAPQSAFESSFRSSVGTVGGRG